jgi:hypothetical protein
MDPCGEAVRERALLFRGARRRSFSTSLAQIRSEYLLMMRATKDDRLTRSDLVVVEEDDPTRWDLHVVEGDDGAGESVDPDPVVPTVGAN